MAEFDADVLVDTGHNTDYNRSPVVPEYYEGNQMWLLGQYLIEELHKLGRTVKTTKRSRDENPSVTARGRMAAGCKIAVGEHSNAGGLGKTDRAVGICMVDDGCGPIDELSRELARRLAEADKEVMGLKDPYQVYERKSGKDRDGDGKKNDDYYGFLYGAHQVGVATVIIENGFHDHGPTAKWLLDDGNLRRLAKAHAAVIDEFLREHFDKKEEHNMSNTMRPGDRGENVRQLQGILRLAGYYDGELDGSYGPLTTGAVNAFQAANGLEADGVAGPKTRAKINTFEFTVKEVADVSEPIYRQLEDIPDGEFRSTAAVLMAANALNGRGDERGLDLTERDLRQLLIMRRYVDAVTAPALGGEIHDDLVEIPGGDDIVRPVEPPAPNVPTITE